MRKTIRLLVAIMLCVLTVFNTTIATFAISSSEIIQQIINTYSAALSKAGRTSFDGYCGLYVNWQLVILGINTSYVGANGNDEFDKYKNMSVSSGGYSIAAYPSGSYSLNSALNAISQNGTKDVTNILVGFEKGWGTEGALYGHTCFIHAIIGGNVYYSESFNATVGGTYYNEGKPIVCSIATFCSYYSAITLDGLIHFYKDEGYLSQCDPFPSYCTLKISDSTCKIKSLPCSVNTDPSSETVEVPSVGDIYTAVKLYENTAGNYWYQVDCKNGKTGYLYAGDCAYVSSLFSDISGSNIDVPSSLSVGASYPVTGTVSTSYNNISKVSVYIYPGSATSGTAETGDEESVDTKFYNLQRLDANVKYNVLSAGTHNYVCKATAYGWYATGTKTKQKVSSTAIVKQQTFTVGSVSKYYLDINGLLDGANVNNISGYGTCDVYINGSRVADDVSDYYTQWPVGTTYEIKDIRACSGYVYEGVASGSLSGTIGNSNINVRLKFSTEQVAGSLSVSNTYLNLSYGESSYVYVTVSGSLPSAWYISYNIVNSNSASVTLCTWHERNGMTWPLEFYGNADGSSLVCISLVDDTNGTVLNEVYVTVNVSRPKIDYGEFYAYIYHWDSDKRIVNEWYTTPYGKELEITGTCSKYDTYYIWHFIPLGGGYYRIENEYDEMVLTASPNDTTDLGGNVLYLTHSYDYQDERQIWMLCESSDGYGMIIVNKETGLLVDIYNGDTNDGNFLQLYYENGASAQRFYLHILDYPGLIPINAPTLYGTVLESYGAVDWTESPLTSSWDTRYYHVSVESSDVILLQYDTAALYIEDLWKVGRYNVTVTAVNPYYSSYRSGSTATSSIIFNINPYCVTFDANGGVAEYSQTYLYYGEPYGYLPVAWRDGYVFTGWYTNVNGGTLISETDEVPYSIPFSTLYAHWVSNCEYFGHSFVDTVTAPTCISQGYTTYTCSVCGYSYNDNYISALDHNYSYAITSSPTTTSAGALKGSCSRCGSTTTITLPRLTTTDYNYTVVTAPTCTATGTSCYTWKDTSYGTYKFNVTLSALGHNYVNGVCTRCGAAESSQPANPFVDVIEGKYYFDAVMWAISQDPPVTSGKDETHFAPKDTCTRGQVVTFLWNAMGKPAPTITDCPFVDVKPGKYYYDAMLWALETGITSGKDDTHFAPNETCTRGQVVTFIWNAMGKPEPTITDCPFVDAKPGKYYYNAMLWALENGVTSGTDATHFSPNQTCTRGQVVTFLYNTLS